MHGVSTIFLTVHYQSTCTNLYSSRQKYTITCGRNLYFFSTTITNIMNRLPEEDKRVIKHGWTDRWIDGGMKGCTY